MKPKPGETWLECAIRCTRDPVIAKRVTDFFVEAIDSGLGAEEACARAIARNNAYVSNDDPFKEVKSGLGFMIREQINIHSREENSNSPDFVLAQFLMDCLNAFEKGINRRDHFLGYEIPPKPQTEVYP